jgi:hypothetical protein
LRVQLVIRDAPGICPIDKTPLVPITAALYFTCAADGRIRELSPGACADGAARVKTYERRPHGDHNPRHGGTLFMASDQWHHLEGTFVAPGIFRVYFFDDMTRPIPADGFVGRVTRTDGSQAIGAVAGLGAGTGDPSTRDAKIGSVAWPLNLRLQVIFKPGTAEQQFDFTFGGYSREP